MAQTLYIDLENKSFQKITTPVLELQTFLGSRGYAAKILYDRVGPEVKPLQPENLLIFSVGLFTGTNWPTGARMTVTAKSPATGAYGYSNTGGHIGAEIRRCGYDAVVISGRSSTPVYIHLYDNEGEILPADDLWGTDAVESEERLTERHEKHRACCIGQAGENMVYFGAIITAGGRAAGRTGMGAVMGSKNLKALVVRGSKKVKISGDFRKTVVQKAKKLLKNPAVLDYQRWGTSILMNFKHPRGDIPTKNYQECQISNIKDVNAQALDVYVDKSTGCFSCPIRCGRHSKVESGPYAHEADGPEYETLNSFAPLVGNSNMEVVLYASNLCNRYGLDTISTGSMIAFAMECKQRGLLRDSELSLEWGDPKTILGLIKKITLREGLGNILADGVKRAAQKIHPDAEKLALHVKGVETPRQEPRTSRGLALGHVTSGRGADHLYGLCTIDLTHNERAAKHYFPDADEEILDPFSQKYKPRMLTFTEAFAAISDALGICKFSTIEAYALDIEDIVEGLNAFFEEEKLTVEELMRIGERIVNLERMYNVRQGMDRSDDALPERFLHEPLTVYVEKDGVLTDEIYKDNLVVDLDEMIQGYYKERGWSSRGIPTKEKLKELGIGELIRDIPKEKAKT